MAKTKHWFAVYTRSRAEKKVASDLGKGNLEVYLPLLKTLRQWSDRKKMVEEPLIRSYVFVKITEKDFFRVIETFGVVNILKFENKAVPIPDWQINNLKILLKSGKSFDKVLDFQKGDFVRITRGSLKGLIGTVTSSNNKKKIVISLDAPKVNYMVEIQPELVESFKPALI